MNGDATAHWQAVVVNQPGRADDDSEQTYIMFQRYEEVVYLPTRRFVCLKCYNNIINNTTPKAHLHIYKQAEPVPVAVDEIATFAAVEHQPGRLPNSLFLVQSVADTQTRMFEMSQ